MGCQNVIASESREAKRHTALVLNRVYDLDVLDLDMVGLLEDDIKTPMMSTSNSEQDVDVYGIELLNKSAVKPNIDNGYASYNHNQNGNTCLKNKKTNQYSDHVMRMYQEHTSKMNNGWNQTGSKPITVSIKSRPTKRENAKMALENSSQRFPGKQKPMIDWDRKCQGSSRRTQKSDGQQRRAVEVYQKGFASSSYFHVLKQKRQLDTYERNSPTTKSSGINPRTSDPIVFRRRKTTSQLHNADHMGPMAVTKETSEIKGRTESRARKSQIDWSSGGDGSQAIKLVQLTSHSFSDIENYSVSAHSSQTSLTSKSSSTFCPYCDKMGTSISTSADHIYEYYLRSMSWSLARSALREALLESIKETNQMKCANQNTSCRPSVKQNIKSGQLALDDLWQSNNTNNELSSKDKKGWHAHSERNAWIGNKLVDKIIGKNKKQQGKPRIQQTSRKFKKSKFISSEVNPLKLSNEYPPSEPISGPMGSAKFHPATGRSKHESDSRASKSKKLANKFSVKFSPISIQHIPNEREASRIAAKALIRLNKAVSEVPLVHPKSAKNADSVKFDQSHASPYQENHPKKVDTTSGIFNPYTAEHGRNNDRANSIDIVIKPCISMPPKQQGTHSNTITCVENNSNEMKSGVPYKHGVIKPKKIKSEDPSKHIMDKTCSPKLDVAYKSVMAKPGVRKCKQHISFALNTQGQNCCAQRLFTNEGNEPHMYVEPSHRDHSSNDEKRIVSKSVHMPSIGLINSDDGIAFQRIIDNPPERNELIKISDKPCVMSCNLHSADHSNHKQYPYGDACLEWVSKSGTPQPHHAKLIEHRMQTNEVRALDNVISSIEIPQSRVRSFQPLQKLALPSTDNAKTSDDIILSSFSPCEQMHVQSIPFENVPRVSKLNKKELSLHFAKDGEQSRDVPYMLQHEKNGKANNQVHNKDSSFCKSELKSLQATEPTVQSFDTAVDTTYRPKQNMFMKGMLDFELLAASFKGKDEFSDSQSLSPHFKSMSNKTQKMCDVETPRPYLGEQQSHTSKHVQDLKDVSTNTDEAWERLKTGIPSSRCMYPRNSPIWNIVQSQCASKSSSETTFLTARSTSIMQLVGPVDELIMQSPTDYNVQSLEMLKHHSHDVVGCKNGSKQNRYSMFHALYPFTVYSTSDVSNDEGHRESYGTSNSGQSGDQVSLGNHALDISTASVSSNYEPLKYIADSSSELIVCTAGDSDIRCSGGDHANVSDEEHFAVHVLTSLADEKGYESEESHSGRAKYVQEIRLKRKTSTPLSEAAESESVHLRQPRPMQPRPWTSEGSLRFCSTGKNTNPEFYNPRLDNFGDVSRLKQGHAKSSNNHHNATAFECDSDESSIKVKFATKIEPRVATVPQSYRCMKGAVCQSMPSKNNAVRESLTDLILSSDSAHTLVHQVNHSKSKTVDHICYARL